MKAKKVLSVCTTVIIVLLVLIVAFNLISAIKRSVTKRSCETVLGLGTAVVISGSMEDAISINDMVVIWKTNDYEVGDVVTFQGRTHPVTHRIIEKRVENGQEFFVTQGDANNTPDDEIPRDLIVGEVIAVIPGVGAIQTFLSQPAGFLSLTLIAGAIILLPEYLRRKEDAEDREEEGKE